MGAGLIIPHGKLKRKTEKSGQLGAQQVAVLHLVSNAFMRINRNGNGKT